MPDDAPHADDTPERRRAAIKARLDAGEWLRVVDVAALFGVDVATVHRWRRDQGRTGTPREVLLRTRPTSPAGGRTPVECDPEDVRALLAKLRRDRGGQV